MTTGAEWSVNASDEEWNDYDPKNGEALKISHFLFYFFFLIYFFIINYEAFRSYC